jgi:pimeloyl-ACP methyl ester carboxylesterase
VSGGHATKLAPEVVEEDAVRRFTTPTRARAGQEAREPEVASLHAQRATVQTPSGGLAVWEWGEGPTVLLVHGWNGGAAQLSGFVGPLVRAGFRVVAFDQPAHGKSTGETATLSEMVDATLAVAWRFGPVHGIVAHSLGATAASLALRRGLAVNGAVLLAPPVEVPRFARAFAKALGLPEARVRGVLDRLSRRLGADLASFDLRRSAPEMRTPVLVVHDSEDREVPFEQALLLVAAWPGARLLRVHGLGHRRTLADAAVIEEAVRFVAAGGR